jgi:Protein of unknown function (DUF3489)
MSKERNNPTSNRPALKLSDAQLVLLSAAAQRDDHCLTVTPTAKGRVAGKVIEKLIAGGLVKEVLAKARAPVWRRDDENARSYALKLTAAGLKAIAVDPDERQEAARELKTTSRVNRSNAAPTTLRKEQGRRTDAGHGRDAEELRVRPDGSLTETPPAVPRAGSKLAEVIGLLSRDQGATNGELMAATNWLPHTTRAALTGLRKRGYAIERSRSDRVTRYRLSNATPIAGPTGGDANEGVRRSMTEHKAA